VNYLFGIPVSGTVQLTIIVIITLIATASVVSGLDAGIKRLSQFNLILAVALLLYVFLCAPSLFLLEAFVQNTGFYLSEVVNKTFTMYAYEPNTWLGGWTLFYWAWWIAWSPFVGMFIARISRGRTIRQFIVGVLFVPSGFTFLWLTVFGNTAIFLDMNEAAGAISATVSENVPLALFRFFEYLPWTTIISVLATILVVTFFVTSSDSGSLVVDSLTNGGRGEGPVWQRSFWALSEGAIAAVLLLSGGLQALQTASIITALPFTFIMLFVCYGMLRSLRLETYRRASQKLATSLSFRGTDIPWQARLRTVLTYPSKSAALGFLKNTVHSALEEVAEELRQSNLEVAVEMQENSASLTVHHEGARDFLYAVHLRGFDRPSFALFKQSSKPKEREQYFRAEVYLLEGSQDYDIIGYTRAQVIADVVSQYEKHMHFLHISR
jgi:choline/glycine/proline betaine transport protein